MVYFSIWEVFQISLWIELGLRSVMQMIMPFQTPQKLRLLKSSSIGVTTSPFLFLRVSLTQLGSEPYLFSMFSLRARMVELGSTLSSGILREERLCSRSILIIAGKNLLFVLESLKFIPDQFYRFNQNQIFILSPNQAQFNIQEKFDYYLLRLNYKKFSIMINAKFIIYFRLYNNLPMNLTLIFIVLSIAIGYMLYDTFKKSKQTLPQQHQTVASKIKTNYAEECKILKDLHEDKMNSLKHRSISIHLDQQKGLSEQKITDKYLGSLENVMTCLNKSTKVYVLVNKKMHETTIQKHMRKYLAQQQFIPYSSIEGAVAVLRQLSCNIHLESQGKLLKIIKQYIPHVWFVGNDEDGNAKYCFSNEFQMVNSLQKLIEAYDLRKQAKND